MEQQGWYITQSNNLQQYDNRITSAPLGRCRGIINMISFQWKGKILLFFSNSIEDFTVNLSCTKQGIGFQTYIFLKKEIPNKQ